MKIKAADHIGLNVSDMEQNIVFYRDILGLAIISDKEMEGRFLDTVQGKEDMRYRIVKFESPEGFMIELLEDLNHKMSPQPELTLQDVGLRHFAYEVEDVDAAYETVSKAGFKTISRPETSEDKSMRLFFVRDPENNLVELMQFKEVK